MINLLDNTLDMTDEQYEEAIEKNRKQSEEAIEKSRKQRAEQKELLEMINEGAGFVFDLKSSDEIKVAVNLLLPFITKNIELADSKKLAKLAVRLDSDETTVVKKSGSLKGTTYRTMNIERLKSEAPKLYKYLVDEEGFKPLIAEPTLLVVRRKRMKDDANIASKADGLGKAPSALKKFAEREVTLEPNSTVNPLELNLEDYKEL